jgi:outer membrane lipoprotein-sorting protein
VFLLQEDDYQFYDQENEQLTVGKVKDRSRQWLWQLFFSDDILQYTSTIGTSGTVATGGAAEKKIFIKKQHAEEPLNIEILLNSDYLPVEVIQQDPNTGSRMIFYFKDYKEKIVVPGDAFELKVPKNVETIEENG